MESLSMHESSPMEKTRDWVLANAAINKNGITIKELAQKFRTEITRGWSEAKKKNYSVMDAAEDLSDVVGSLVAENKLIYMDVQAGKFRRR